MTNSSMTFDAVNEAKAGPKWRARWKRSWPAYEAWFVGRGGDNGPDRKACEAALQRYMPELVPVHRELTRLAGGGDRAARFLSTWCPPAYLGGCSIAAVASANAVRLVRNYDLSPDLNEGLLLRSAWTGRPVMGMVEFLWGLSDGINADGLSVALAYGGRQGAARGFGITTILRYILETCTTVPEALEVLERVPSHMAYNVVLADRNGGTASVELSPGGGVRVLVHAIATNHQGVLPRADRPEFTRTVERNCYLEALLAAKLDATEVENAFLEAPLFQTNYAAGFGTLFTAIYDPLTAALTLRWTDSVWRQNINDFDEGSRVISFATLPTERPAGATLELEPLVAAVRPYVSCPAIADAWLLSAKNGGADWVKFGAMFAATGRSTQCRAINQ